MRALAALIAFGASASVFAQDLTDELTALGLKPGQYTVTSTMLAQGAIHSGIAVGTATVSLELKQSALMVKVAYKWPDGASAENIYVLSFDYIEETYVLTAFIGPSSMVRTYRGKPKDGAIRVESAGTINSRYAIVANKDGSVAFHFDLLGSAGDWQSSAVMTLKLVVAG